LKTMIDLSVLMSEPAAENWIQIMKTGEFDHPMHGKLKIAPADLHQFKENFDKNVRGTDLAVDVSHKPDAGAVAWFKELKVDGEKLMAKVAWTEEGKELVSSGKYRYFSPEFTFQYKDAESGKQFRDVLLGGAITNRPFLKNMDPIEFSEDESYGTVWFAEDEGYDPDNDDDDDSTTDPDKNPDWMLDVMAGITPWPDSDQQAKLKEVGATKQACDAAYQIRQKQLGSKGLKSTKMSEPSEADKAKQAQESRAKKYGIKPHEGGAITKPNEYQGISDDMFADPVNYAYPIDAEHVLAAYRYFAKSSNQAKYTPEERKVVAKRIVEHLPEKYKAEANKAFKFEDDTKPSDNHPSPVVPGDGPDDPHNPQDVDAGKFKEPAQHKKTNDPKGATKMTDPNKDQVISLSEHNAALDRIKMLEEQNKRVQMSEKVKGFMFNESTKKGKILPAQQEKVLDLMLGMNDEQVAKFEEVINALPDAISFNDERGHGLTGGTKDRASMVSEKADALLKEGKAQDYRSAILMAEDEIPEIIK
jgi:phage I-like protein